MKCDELFKELVIEKEIRHVAPNVYVTSKKEEPFVTLVINDDDVDTAFNGEELRELLESNRETVGYVCPVCGEVLVPLYIEPFTSRKGCKNCFTSIMNDVYGRENWDIILFREGWNNEFGHQSCMQSNYFDEEFGSSSWSDVVDIEEWDQSAEREELFNEGELFIKTSVYKKLANKYIRKKWVKCRTLKNNIPYSFLQGYEFMSNQHIGDLTLDWVRVEISALCTIDAFGGC